MYKAGCVFRITTGKHCGLLCKIVEKRNKEGFLTIWQDKLQTRLHVTLKVPFMNGESILLHGSIDKKRLAFVNKSHKVGKRNKVSANDILAAMEAVL